MDPEKEICNCGLDSIGPSQQLNLNICDFSTVENVRYYIYMAILMDTHMISLCGRCIVDGMQRRADSLIYKTVIRADLWEMTQISVSVLKLNVGFTNSNQLSARNWLCG
jgi:hypothetical protein